MHSGTHGSAKVGFQCVALQFVGRCHTTLQLWMGFFSCPAITVHAVTLSP